LVSCSAILKFKEENGFREYKNIVTTVPYTISLKLSGASEVIKYL
jgi:hypothetical protein